MATESNILCEKGDNFIPLDRKSDKYCSESCSYEDKLVRERERNRAKAVCFFLLTNDDILHDLYLDYGSDVYISTSYLLLKNFNWDLFMGITHIENYQAFNQIRYTYILFNNQTIRIWKL